MTRRQRKGTPNNPQPIKAGKFTFRTLHATGRHSAELTLDKMITVTMPAIDGEGHKMIPTMEVTL